MINLCVNLTENSSLQLAFSELLLFFFLFHKILKVILYFFMFLDEFGLEKHAIFYVYFSFSIKIRIL